MRQTTRVASGGAEPIDYRRGEIRALTGLRFVAAAAVVVHHFAAPDDAPTWLRNIIGHGWIGVPLFFMLSGTVLAYNYPTLSLRDGRGTLRFWIARLARVMPLYWVMIAYVATIRVATDAPQYELWRHVLSIQTWSGDVTRIAYAYNAPGWSINVELFLYLLFPLLVPLVAALARRGTTPLVALIVACMAVEWALVFIWQSQGWANLPATFPESAHRWLYRNPLTRLPEFVMGMAIAFLIHRGTRIGRTPATVVHAGVLVWVLFFSAFESGHFRHLQGAYFAALWSVPFVLLIWTLAASDGAPLTRLLATRPMVALGAASYALYLTHRPLIAGFGNIYSASVSDRVDWVLMIWVLLLSMCVAEGAHRYLEVPVRRTIVGWSRRVLGDGRRPDPAEEASVVGDATEVLPGPADNRVTAR